MAENNSWEIFFRLLCESKSREATKNSALYKLIIQNYPIQLMQKLISTVVVDENLSQKKRESAALFVLQEMIHTDGGNVIQENYANIDMQTLDLLRRNAINLMISSERGSILQMCGQHVALELVHSWLETEQKWDGFLEFAEESFIHAPSSAHLEIFLEIFRGLPPHLHIRLMAVMEPCIARNRAQFEAALLQVLRDARDETPFLILPCIISTFNQPLSPTFTQAAVMSNLFNDVTSFEHQNMLQIAIILRYCVQHTRPFKISKVALIRLKFIICAVAVLTNVRAALQLHEEYKKKYYEYYPRSRCRQPDWDWMGE